MNCSGIERIASSRALTGAASLYAFLGLEATAAQLLTIGLSLDMADYEDARGWLLLKQGQPDQRT